jgi:transposase-like protein
MRSYSKEQKAALMAKMLEPNPVSVPELAKETGIPKDTLYGWRNRAGKAAGVVPAASGSRSARWSSEEKFTAVVETALMNEAELGAYCRQRGLYVEQVRRWRQGCVQANDERAHSGRTKRSSEVEQGKRIKQLERELRRKEKALAEAAALLVLEKKARALWGEYEEA